MILKGHIMTKEQAGNSFFSSFEGKYIIMDNLDEKGEPFVHAKDEIYNSEYVFVTVVLRGTLYIDVAGTELAIKANEYLVVTPCMRVHSKDSRCIRFTFLTRSYLMADIYDRTKVVNKLHFNAFKFRHIHLNPEITNTLLECYLRIKSEHMREDYPMKEAVLRAYQSAYIAKFFSYVDSSHLIQYVKSTRQYKLFNEFLYKLNEQYRKERSVQHYAKEMNITPKYLSAIVFTYTGLTASQVIDQYVVFSIKQSLYTNEHNIKAISADFNFPSQSFFGRYFKRITGMSPNEYIKQHNIKSINFTKTNQLEN